MEKRKVVMDTSAYAAFLRGSPGVKEAVHQASTFEIITTIRNSRPDTEVSVGRICLEIKKLD